MGFLHLVARRPAGAAFQHVQRKPQPAVGHLTFRERLAGHSSGFLFCKICKLMQVGARYYVAVLADDVLDMSQALAGGILDTTAAGNGTIRPRSTSRRRFPTNKFRRRCA
jgi:hypothetical protein